MLTMMRNMLRSKAAFLIFLLLIVAMAAWGLSDSFTGSGLGRDLLGAGDRKVTQPQFDSTVERALARISRQDPNNRSTTKEEAVERGIIDSIYAQEAGKLAVMTYADRVGLTATTSALSDFILENPGFQDNTGVFDKAILDNYLYGERLTRKGFDEQLEIDLTIRRLQALPAAGLVTPKSLQRIEAALRTESRAARWFKIPASALPETPEPTDEDLLAHYEKTKATLQRPETRAISLLKITPEDFARPSEITDEAIEAEYDAVKDIDYRGPDSRELKTFTFATEAEARDVLALITAGASEESIPNLISSETISGGPDIISDPNLASRIFSAIGQTGAIFGPVESAGNWTVYRLDAITPGDLRPLEEVASEIRATLSQQAAEEIFYSTGSRLDDLFATGANLERVASELGAPLLSFAPVTQSGVTANGMIMRELATTSRSALIAAFAARKGSKTDRIEVDDTIMIARVDDIIAPSTPAFEEVKETLILGWKRERAQNKAGAEATDIEAVLAEDPAALEGLAAKYNAEIKSMAAPQTRLDFNETDLPRDLAIALFAASTEGEAKTALAPDGGVVVMQVAQINRPTPETLDALIATGAVNIQQTLEEDFAVAFFAEIEKQADVTRNDKAFQAYKNSQKITQ